MKSLVIRTLIVFVLIIVGIQTARVIGAAQPRSAFSQVFTNPDGSPCELPCVFGIRIGQTKHAEAVALLKAHPLTRRAGIEEQGYVIEVRDPELFISFTEDRQRRVWVGVLALNDLSLADTITTLGAPDCLTLGRWIVAYYVQYRLNVIASSGYQQPFDPSKSDAPQRITERLAVRGLDSTANNLTDSAPCSNGSRYDFGISATQWKGFTTLDRYSIP